MNMILKSTAIFSAISKCHDAHKLSVMIVYEPMKYSFSLALCINGIPFSL